MLLSFAKTNQPTYSTYYQYNGLAQLQQADIYDGRARTVRFTNDLSGQAVRRSEQDNLSGGDPHEVWYRFGGKQLGYVGNNGTDGQDYASSVNNRVRAQGQGAFRFGQSSAPSQADFQQSAGAVTSYGGSGAGGSYTARAGDAAWQGRNAAALAEKMPRRRG